MPLSEETNEGQGFIVRLRVRLAKALNVEEAKLAFSVGGCEAVVLSPDMKQPLARDEWAIIRVPGFDDQEQAEAFGSRLETTVQIASLKCRLGVDAGERRATARFGQIVVDHMKEHGVNIHPNVHGLYTYSNSSNVAFPDMKLTTMVRTQPEPFISEITSIFSALPAAELKTYDAVRLMNDALTHSEAVAQVLLALAAVEFLTQGEKWTTAQQNALRRLAAEIKTDPNISASEGDEIADAITRSMHRMGVRQGARRLFANLNLEYLKRIGTNSMIIGMIFFMDLDICPVRNNKT